MGNGYGEFSVATIQCFNKAALPIPFRQGPQATPSKDQSFNQTNQSHQQVSEIQYIGIPAPGTRSMSVMFPKWHI